MRFNWSSLAQAKWSRRLSQRQQPADLVQMENPYEVGGGRWIKSKPDPGLLGRRDLASSSVTKNKQTNKPEVRKKSKPLNV